MSSTRMAGQIADLEQLNKLTEYMQEQWQVRESRAPATDGMERASPAERQGVSYRKADLATALDRNLAAGSLAQGLARQRDPGKVVVKAEARLDFGKNPESGLAKPALEARKALSRQALADKRKKSPRHAEAEVVYEEAVDDREGLWELLNNPPASEPRSAAAAPTPQAQVPVEAVVPEDPERTHVGFEYPEGGKYLADFGPKHVIVGAGNEYVDRERTLTQHAKLVPQTPKNK